MSTPTPTNSPTSSPAKRAPSCGPTPANSPATSPNKPSRAVAAPTPSNSPTRDPVAPSIPWSPADPKPGRVAPPPSPNTSPVRRHRTAPPPAPPSPPALPTAPQPRERGVKSDEAIRMAKRHFGAQWEDTTEERQRRIEEKRHRRWLGAAGRPLVPDKRRRNQGDRLLLRRAALEGWKQQRLREGPVDEITARTRRLDLMED
ncbi:hypothetical protein MCOR25_008325 [Pyricularia grisea]|uniref:Uncharacterized protein n=1 Tax=Pyricularia grisea TaxID=148305 RepID=A0A6P8BG67_PYRGI|nr:uncharacterized protein PgNI_02062 [Pyricularia grisea]KAI6355120.1 hypothetical protein MCOR25_008325 [Pyricularia grisea]TLD15768.1 hypothetical protein PgNI_02062 [Pyricularia grisea]